MHLIIPRNIFRSLVSILYRLWKELGAHECSKFMSLKIYITDGTTNTIYWMSVSAIGIWWYTEFKSSVDMKLLFLTQCSKSCILGIGYCSNSVCIHLPVINSKFPGFMWYDRFSVVFATQLDESVLSQILSLWSSLTYFSIISVFTLYLYYFVLTGSISSVLILWEFTWVRPDLSKNISNSFINFCNWTFSESTIDVSFPFTTFFLHCWTSFIQIFKRNWLLMEIYFYASVF